MSPEEQDIVDAVTAKLTGERYVVRPRPGHGWGVLNERSKAFTTVWYTTKADAIFDADRLNAMVRDGVIN